MALYYAPQFDDPEDPGIYAHTPNVDVATAPESAEGYGDASVPTQMDYARPAIEAGRATQSEAERYAAAARASVEAINQQAILSQDPEYRANVASAQARGEAAALRGELPGQQSIYARAPVRAAPRPGHVPTKRLTTALGTTAQPAIAAEQASAQRDIGRATVAEAAAATDALQQLADRQRALNIDLQAEAHAKSEHYRQARALVDGTRDEARRLQSEFSKTSEVDPGRWWASRTAFQKFAAVLSSAMLGFAGMDPFSHLQAAVREDIDAQRSNIDLRRSKVDAAERQHRYAVEEAEARLGDKTLADNAVYMARMEQAKAEVIAQLQAAGQQMTGATVKKLFADIDEELAKKHYENEMIAERNTPMVAVGGGYLMPAEERADRRKRAMAADAGARDAEARGGKVLEQREAVRGDIAKEEAKARMAGSKPDAAQRRIDVDQKKWLTEKVAPFRNEERLITQIQEEYANNIPGFVFGLGFKQHLQTKEETVAYERIKRAVIFKLRRESGANTPESEIEREAGAILSRANSEEAIHALLDDRLAEARGWIDYYERAPEQGAVEDVNRGQSGERAPLTSGGSGLPDIFDQYADE